MKFLFFGLLFATATSPSTRAQDRDSVIVLPVVSVTRIPTRFAQVPFAVSRVVFGADRAVGRNINISEALGNIPGVQVQDRHNFAVGDRITLRGFGARSQFGIRGMRVIVDGIPATVADGQTTLDHVDLGSVAEVEVLRGPAGSIYGNEAGGAIVIATGGLDGRRSGRVTLTAGGNGLRRASAEASGSAGDVRYRVKLAAFGWNGFREHSRAERYHGLGRAAVPVGRGEIRLVANLVRLDARNPGSLSDSVFRIDPRAAHGFNVVQGTLKQVTQGQIGATFTGPAGGLELGLAVYTLFRDLHNPIPTTVVDLFRQAAGFRGSVTGSLGERGRLVLGFDLDVQRDDRRNFANEAGDEGPLSLDQDETVVGGGPFLRVSWRPRNRWQLEAGMRADAVVFRVDDAFLSDGAADSGSRTLDALSPSIGVSWTGDSHLNLFANASFGFETPTTTELANRPDGSGGFNPNLEPQKAFGVEIGARGAVGLLTYAVSSFHIAVNDELVPFEVPSSPGRTFFRNSGRSRRSGIEFEVELQGGSFDIRSSYTFLDAAFVEFAVGPEDFSGNSIPGVARHTWAGTATFAPRTWLSAVVEARFRSNVPADDANIASAEEVFVGNVAVVLRRDVLAWGVVDVFAQVVNMFDANYAGSLVVNAFGARYFEPAPGRELYVGISLGGLRRRSSIFGPFPFARYPPRKVHPADTALY
ncbi:MAG: TonB-dependent receptor family protein [Gemmatimonadales bacterium]